MGSLQIVLSNDYQGAASYSSDPQPNGPLRDKPYRMARDTAVDAVRIRTHTPMEPRWICPFLIWHAAVSTASAVCCRVGIPSK